MEAQPVREHPEVQITSEDRKSILRLGLVERALTHHPSVELVIEVKDDEWSGFTIAWFSEVDISAFNTALKSCEGMRQGTAKLVAMSPENVELAIESVDSIGHFRLSYRLTQHRSLRNGFAIQALAGAFDLDSEFINQLVDSIALFFNEALISHQIHGAECQNGRGWP